MAPRGAVRSYSRMDSNDSCSTEESYVAEVLPEDQELAMPSIHSMKSNDRLFYAGRRRRGLLALAAVALVLAVLCCWSAARNSQDQAAASREQARGLGDHSGSFSGQRGHSGSDGTGHVADVEASKIVSLAESTERRTGLEGLALEAAMRGVPPSEEGPQPRGARGNEQAPRHPRASGGWADRRAIRGGPAAAEGAGAAEGAARVASLLEEVGVRNVEGSKLQDVQGTGSPSPRSARSKEAGGAAAQEDAHTSADSQGRQPTGGTQAVNAVAGRGGGDAQLYGAGNLSIASNQVVLQPSKSKKLEFPAAEEVAKAAALAESGLLEGKRSKDLMPRDPDDPSTQQGIPGAQQDTKMASLQESDFPGTESNKASPLQESDVPGVERGIAPPHVAAKDSRLESLETSDFPGAQGSDSMPSAARVPDSREAQQVAAVSPGSARQGTGLGSSSASVVGGDSKRESLLESDVPGVQDDKETSLLESNMPGAEEVLADSHKRAAPPASQNSKAATLEGSGPQWAEGGKELSLRMSDMPGGQGGSPTGEWVPPRSSDADAGAQRSQTPAASLRLGDRFKDRMMVFLQNSGGASRERPGFTGPTVLEALRGGEQQSGPWHAIV
mmetsp:Transcript_110647/g.308256  ORF Transcript_110647/g.308256 Transcript_110647/m.308256 type:complete len:614 (-) Transcript_110647:109-1950(-)